MSGSDYDFHVQKQRGEWNAVAGAWEKYDQWMADNFAGFDKILIEKAGVKPGHHVLDLGSGTGNPSLAAARVVGPQGRVVGLDVAEKMLEVARRRAGAQGITNVEYHACDAGAIPFEDEKFDAATSRFCLMFLPDVGPALRHVHRALKPGGRFTAAVWATPDKNLSFTLAMRALQKFIDMPAQDPNAPGPFSQGKPGVLAGRMKEAGFTEAREEAAPVEMVFPSLEFYMDNLQEMAAPVRALMERLDEQTRARAMSAIVEEVKKHETPDGVIRFQGEALIVSGVKGAA
ncbi:MAG: methyltransferase domain-containing protein [Nitrospinota bacterium]|nr:methyltransferase domain-containing protein [Nitrospinota bacterium]